MVTTNQRLKEPAFAKLKPDVVLCVVAHPDDAEFGMAGSVASFAKAGSKVYYLVLTDASKGTSDRNLSPTQLTKIRQREQREAAKILGVRDVFFGQWEDGALEVNQQLKKEIVRHIRKLRPNVVISMDPTMVYSSTRGFINHPDHRAAGQATLDAVYPLARDHLAYSSLLIDEKLEPHKVSTVLLVNFDKTNFAMDISPVIDLKLKALAAHSSQLPVPPDSTLEMVKSWAKVSGSQFGYQYAESFVRIDIS